jgi:phytoene synthase
MRAVERASLVNAETFARCGEEVRRHDPDRFYAALFAPEATRKRLLALYAFNLEIARVRERVNEPMLGEVRLQWWREALDQIFAGRPLRHDVSEALAHTIEATGLPRAPFDALIEARRFDLYEAPMETEEALATYACATASGLVALAAQALTAESLSPALLEAADAAGRAWAYTGVLRALPIHAARRQLFLPHEHLVLAGGDAESVFARKPSPALAETIRALAVSSRTAIAEARASFVRAGAPRTLPAFLMLALVPPMLAAFERRGFDPFRGSAELSPLYRLCRLTGAGLLGRF